MKFTVKKLPLEAAGNLLNCPIHTVQPFALMLAPVYVLMKRNAKFVSVKRPLDFFLPEELDRYRSFESFFFSAFAKTAVPYRDAGRRVRAILSWMPSSPDALPPAPYETSDAVLRVLGPLWGNINPEEKNPAIEPYFTAIFTNEFCDFLPEDVLRETRERDVNSYEWAILRSSVAVFLALHLGYCTREFLNSLRLRVFQETVKNASLIQSTNRFTTSQTEELLYTQEVEELIDLVFQIIHEPNAKLVGADWFAQRNERTAKKIASRLSRIKNQFMDPKRAPSTIYGPEGIIDE